MPRFKLSPLRSGLPDPFTKESPRRQNQPSPASPDAFDPLSYMAQDTDLAPRFGVEFRRLEHQNAEIANSLFNRVFEQQRPLSHYQWKFWDAPAGPPIGILAFDQQKGELLSANTGLRKRVRVLGENHEAMMLCESATAPGSRGGGRAYRTATLGTGKVAAEEGLLFAYGGQSTDEAIKIGARWFNYGVIFQLRTWERRLSLRPALQSRLGKLGSLVADLGQRVSTTRSSSSQSEIQVEEVTEFDGSFDELWERFRDMYPLVFARDAESLRWRYAACPLYEHHTLVARENGRPIGYVIFRKWVRGSARLATVLDFVDCRERAVAEELLRQACDLATQQGCDFLHFAVKENSIAEEAMKSLGGFRISDRERPDRIIATPMRVEEPTPRQTELIRTLVSGGHWYYTQGDCDYLD